MAQPQRSDGQKNDEHHDSLKTESNLTGLKHALHGTSYQLKLGIVVSLANAKKSLNPANDFSFKVTAEDPTAGKFDDIVYAFDDGAKTGVLKIQVQHKLGSPVPKKITCSEFTTTSDTKNAYAILKYFASFCDQQQSTTELEGFIICTNADIEDNAKDLWKSIETAVTDESSPSLDFYVSSLFDNIGGKCYQLNYNNLLAADSTLSKFYELLRKCSKRARLAKLMVDATKPNKKITGNNSLCKEYRQAILNAIDRNETSKSDSYGFTKEFIVSSSSNSTSGNEAFRKEFEDQYRQEYKIEGCVWDDLKLKRVYVVKDFLSDGKNEYASSDTFPDDNVDEYLKSFCERFRLVCDTYNEQGLDDVIPKLWRNLHCDRDTSGNDRRKGRVEEKMVADKLFKTNFDWLLDPFAKPLHSNDVKKDLENIEGRLAYMKLEPTSDKLRKKLVGSPFRISPEALKDSKLYAKVETESLLAVEAFDIQFGATVLSDIFGLQRKDSACTLFVDEMDFINDSDSVKTAINCVEARFCLVIICHEAFMSVQNNIQKWEKDVQATAKQVFVINKTNDIPSDLSCFCLSDLAEESLDQFKIENISLCGTVISSSKIFQNSFMKLPIETIIKLLDWGKQMKEYNVISKKYREIANIYVHRPWIDLESNFETNNIRWEKDSDLYKRIKDPQREAFSFKKIIKQINGVQVFHQIFEETNNPEEEHEPINGDEGKKMLILLGEAGHGKSTSIKWLAWRFQQQNPSSWVVPCNLSDHCSLFKPFIRDQGNGSGTIIIVTEALRMLYKLVHSSLQFEQNMAEKCSKYIILFNGEAILDEELMKYHGLSLYNSIQLMVFKEMFNAGELVLLFDGFDEIAPHYKEVVLKFLSVFEKFKGVKKLYLTSRPYGFKDQFQKLFKKSLFFQLKPLSLQAKGAILFKMMTVRWHNGSIGDEEVFEFYKSMCFMLLCSLGSMSDVPLNLMMAVEIMEDCIYHNQSMSLNFSSKTFSRKLFETILDISKASFIVEEFVKVKIRHLLFDKNGLNKNVADKPHEMEKFEQVIGEAKLLHGLVALMVFFDECSLVDVLSDVEMRDAKNYMHKIQEGDEKSGIIHEIQNGVPLFIHRTFAEYLAAWWIIQRQIEGKQHGTIKMSSLKSFWDGELRALRGNIDTILARRHPLHLAVIEWDWETVQSILSTNPKSLFLKDVGKRTPLHLFALYYDFRLNWLDFISDSTLSDLTNTKEKIFGWTALDYAFHRDKPRLIFYLLHNGASINVDVLYEQVTSARKDVVRKAAKYVRYVMEYLSRQVVMCDSHDAFQKMKEFCGKVVAESANFERTYDPDYMEDDVNLRYEISTREVIQEDSVWMLESVIQQGKHFDPMIWDSFFKLALKSNSIFVLKFFIANDPSILNNDYLWKCVVYAALKDYKEEFKYFIDLYCSYFRIKDFHPCSIQSDEACYLIDYFENNVNHSVCYISIQSYWTKLGMPDDIGIDEKILSLLVVCVASVRPSMLKYLKESCKLNVSAGLVYCIAKATNYLFTKIHRRAAIKPTKAYDCLLDLIATISDREANDILRLAITSNLFQFSKCLIERCNIDFQGVDELNGWNVFHLCISDQSSFWAKKQPNEATKAFYVDGDKTDLFRYMLAKETGMDCFDVIDKKGRSILALAMENGRKGIVKHIVARKLGLDDFDEIENLSVDDILNLTFCYDAIHKLSKSVGEKGAHQEVLCVLAKQIALILQTNCAESYELNSAHLLLNENAKELYQIAMKGRSLFLLYYLQRTFPSAIPPFIYDADWLACTVNSLRSSNFLDVTKWLFNSNEVDEHANLYEVVKKCDVKVYDLESVNLEKLVRQVEAILSANRSVEDVCKLKLFTLAVCLERESMIRYICDTLKVNINWKVLIAIMVIAHQSYIYKPDTKDTDGCAFEKPDFLIIYKYMIERTANLGQIDAEGKNVLHLAVKYGLGCMAKFLIKYKLSNVTAINEQNGWNIFHYYAAGNRWRCCFTVNKDVLSCIIKRVLEIPSNIISLSSLTECEINKIKELCFSSNEGRKSVIDVAVEAGNIGTAEHIIELSLGIDSIDEHEIRNPDQYSRFTQCYDLLRQASQLPFNEKYDYLLHRLAKSILRFSPEKNEHITKQENVEDHIVEDACRTAIRYRSLSTLEQLIILYEDQVNQSLARCSGRELLTCMMECIRGNRPSMFKVLVGHYRILQGIQPRVEFEFEKEENEINNKTTIDENRIQWSIIHEITEDEMVVMNRDYLALLILSVAYGRLPMTQYLVEMLRLEVNKSSILLTMKVLGKLWNQNGKIATPVYEYLASRCEGKPNLLHLCVQAKYYNMLECLMKENKLDPNEKGSRNKWNVGYRIVSEPASDAKSDNALKVFELLIEKTNMDCLGVYEPNGRRILDLALENGHTRIVEYIINHRLGIGEYEEPWKDWDLEKTEKRLNELQQILESLPQSIPQHKQQVIQNVLEKVRDQQAALTIYYQLFEKHT